MSDIKKDNSSLSLSSDDSNFRLFLYSFLNNDHHTFVVQKTEKLASALYLVTNRLSGEEPLRTRLRVCALDLVSSTTDRARTQSGEAHDNFGSRCLEVVTILKLAERAGLLSPMNAKVLCDEYGDLATFVREHRDVVFGGPLDAGGKKTSLRVPLREDATAEYKGQFKESNTSNGKRHSNRQNLILELFSKKDKITVKDAKSLIIGCSEKTIQREIMSLVEEGVLIKEGERRWSAYRKAQSVIGSP